MRVGAPPYFFDPGSLAALGRERADDYQGAAPFAHIVLDDFLPEEVALSTADAFPGPDDIDWDLYTDNGKTLKLATTNEALMPPEIRHLIGQFNSGATIGFLEALTGIKGLVADPHIVGGGIHRIEPGGFLEVHADFNRHPVLHLERRINLLFYLNPDWQEEWGGQLELWDTSMTRCERRVSPILNRCVIFNTTDTSYHGHPQPLGCPPGRGRQSLAFYYYTQSRPTHEQSAPHSTLYKTEGGRPMPSADPPARSQSLVGSVRHRVGTALPPSIRRPVKRALGLAGAGGGSTASRPASVPSAPSAAPAPSPGSENHWARVYRMFEALRAEGKAPRPNYTWSLLHVADIARHLGYPRFTAIEFGVAGGNGLVALEQAAQAVEDLLGVGVDLVGFDNAVGLPPAEDHRDAPYAMEAGQFPMDEPRLRSRLSRSKLHLGLVKDTLTEFVPDSPVGFISLDVDYYSSSVDAFGLLEQPAERFLPRVLSYFDDSVGYPWGDSNGERRAATDFNASHTNRIIDHLIGFRYNLPASQFNARWADAMYLIHILDHPRYAEDEGTAITTRLDLT